MAKINSIALAAAKIAEDRRKREEEKSVPKIASTGSGGSVQDYLKEREARIKSGKQESDDVMLQRRQTRLAAENSAAERQLRSRALEALHARIDQGLKVGTEWLKNNPERTGGQLKTVDQRVQELSEQIKQGANPEYYALQAMKNSAAAGKLPVVSGSQMLGIDPTMKEKYVDPNIKMNIAAQGYEQLAKEWQNADREQYYSLLPLTKGYSENLQNPYTRLDTETRVKAQLEGEYSQREERMDAMTDEELNVMTYIRNTQGTEAAQQYYKFMEEELGRRVREGYTERAQKFGQERPVLGSALSTWMNMGNAIRGGAYVAGNALDKLTGSGTEIDPYDRAFEMGAMRDAMRSGVSEDMPGWGKFLYDTGMSMADTAAMGLALGSTGGALLMGSGAAVDTVRDVKERGGSDQQALTMGLIAGGAELLTEKLGFDRLGELVGGSRGNVFREILGAMTSEGFEEGVTEIANILTDVLVMGDASNYAAAVRQYMLQGMSEKEAHIRAVQDMAEQVSLSALGGGLMGGVMGGGAATVGRVNENYRARTDALNFGARGDYLEYDPALRLTQQAAEDQQGTTPQSTALTAPLGEGEPDVLPASRTVSPTIERMAQEYGEDASVFKSHYNGSDPEQYKRGFDAMFNAGKSGLSLEMLGGVSDQLTAGMDEATKQSIYTAGLNKAAQTITPGAKNLTTGKLTSEQRTFLRVWDAIGKEYGFEVDLVDDVKDANGAYRSGGRRIVVSANATEGALTQAAGHETVHYLKSVNPEGYSVLEDTVLRYLTDEDSMFDLETAIKERMKEYAGKNPTREEAIEEIVAEAVPTFFSDRAAATEFANRNPTLAEKIRDFFYDFVKKIREIAERYMQSQNRDEIANLLNKTEALTEIARTLDAGLRGAQEKAGGAKGDGEIKTAKRRSKDADDLSKWTPDARFMEEIMTAAERGVFRTIMNDRKNLPAKKMPNGEYVIEAGRALVYTDGKLTKPRIRKIVYFYTNDGTDLDGAMDLWRRGEREGIEYECTRTAIEDILGEEGVMVYHNDDFREVQGEDDRRTGTNGRGFGEGNRGEVSADRGTRFSLKADREKNKQVQKAQAEDWQQVSAGEIMVQDLKVDEETVRRQASGALNKGLRDKLNQQIGMAANRILRDTESKYGRNELKEKLSQIVKQYAAHGNAALMAEELAGAIIEKSVRLTESEAAKQYADAREKLRNAKISLTETQKQEIVNEYGSVDAYRKAVFGTVNVRNEGTTLESLWAELSELYPEIFLPETNEAQMPGVIAQFDRMMKPRYENIYGMDTAAAVTDLALRIQGDVLGMVGAKQAAHDLYGTADKFRNQIRKEYDAEIRAQQKARVDEFQQIAGKLKAAKDKDDSVEQKKIMAEYRRALKKVDVKTAISEVRAAEKVRYEQRTETHERAQLREKVTKRANELANMLINPQKGKRVPTKLQGLVMDVLGALDVNGQRAAEQGTETQRAAEFREKLTDIKNFYAQVWDSQSKGDSPEGLDGLMMTLSERNVAEMTEALEVLGSGEAFYLRDMDSKQLKSLDALLKNVKHTVDSIGKLWRIQRYEGIIQLGNASIAEMDSRGRQKITNKAAGAVRDFFVLDNMEPVSYGERLGEAGAAVIQSLMDGEKIKFGKIREASEATERMLKEIGISGYDIGRWRKKVQEVTFGGAKVRITEAQLMGLYLTAKRPKGRQHLLGGGFVLRDPKRTGAQEETIRPTEAELAHIADHLSDKQRQLADRMGEYLSTAVAKWGNDVTQRMYLYDAFLEKHYWPLSSDSSYHKTEEPEMDRMFNAIINASFTKQTDPNADDELVIMDAFDIFGKHIGEMASYAGYAEAMTDTMAWLNYKVRNSETNLNEASVKRSVKKLLGNGGVDYMTKLLQDINGARRETEKTLVDKIGKNAKVAAVVGKISVAIQQPTSIVRAAAEINPWHLIKALRPTKGLPKGKSIGEWLRSNGTVEEMQKWSNLAWWKSNGNYDIGIGKGTDAILWGDTSRLQTAGDIAVNVGELGFDPGKMDDLTWAHMWLAVKSEIKRKRKDLEVGSDEFFRAVAERFEYVMDRTQVVDTVMHRSALMRSKNDVTKQLTSFMSEPTKSYNMLMRAVMNLGRNPKDVAAHKRLMRTTAAFAASVVANAAAKGLYEAFRYRDDDEDKLLEYMVNGEFTEDWKKRILINMVSGLNPLENIPIVSTVYEAIPGDRIAKYLGFGQVSDYLPSGDVAGHMGLEGISDLIKAGVDALQYMFDDNSGKRTKYGVWGALVKAASEAFGLPFAGIMTNVETLGRIFDPKWAQSKSVMATQEKAFAELYKAMASGDGKKALDIRTQLAKGMYGNQPKSPKEIDTGIYKELARQDERVMQAYKMKQAGNQTKELVALRKAIMADGFTEAQVNAAINYCETLTDTEVEEKDMEAELEAKLYSTTDLFSAVRNGDADDVAAVADYLESVSNASDPEKSIRSSVSGEFREEYVDLVKAGQNGKARALAGKLAMVGIDQEYLDGWMKDSYKADMKQHVSDGRVQKALEAIDELKEYGMDVSGIVSSLNSEFRERYVELVNSGRRAEADRLGRTLQELDLYWKDGTTNYYRDEKLEEWLEED